MLNISKQIYIGWDASGPAPLLPEVEIMPIGETPSEKTKLTKFAGKHPNLQEYDNIPLPGFTLHDVSKKTWTASDSTWLVIDPRGFITRITQRNMANILDVTGITEGLIQQRCVWAREDEKSELELIPMSSPDFVEAIENTELIESKVNLDEVEIGDTVLLQNKLMGTYLGVHSLYAEMDRSSMKGNYKVQVALRKQVIEISKGKFHYQTDAKILKVLEKATKVWTREEANEYLNNNIRNNPAIYFTPYARMGGHYYGSHGRIRLASVHAVQKVPINLVEIDLAEASKILAECIVYTDTGRLVVEAGNGKKFTMDFPWWGSTLCKVPHGEFYIDEIASVEKDCLVHTPAKTQYHGVAGRSQKPSFKLDIFAKFYKIVKSVKADTYI